MHFLSAPARKQWSICALVTHKMQTHTEQHRVLTDIAPHEEITRARQMGLELSNPTGRLRPTCMTREGFHLGLRSLLNYGHHSMRMKRKHQWVHDLTLACRRRQRPRPCDSPIKQTKTKHVHNMRLRPRGCKTQTHATMPAKLKWTCTYITRRRQANPARTP